MFDFIPIEYYTSVYYYVIGFILFFTFLNSQTEQITSAKTQIFVKNAGWLLLAFTLLYMGLRPISGQYFGDMATYAYIFRSYQNGIASAFKDDVIFSAFILFCSKIMSVQVFFFTCLVLYVLPLWRVSKKWFGTYWFYGFLALVISFSFWAYGTNGIRNGIATSFFLYAVSKEKLMYKVLLALLAIGIHKSLIIPGFAYCLTYVAKDPKYYFYGWLVCIPLSLASGGFWEGVFSGIMTDDRTARYLTESNSAEIVASTGFRWDFLLYSSSAVYAAYFFIIKNKFIDLNYNRLVCTYLAANAFWVLVIRANFSNRFAYLSWFMMGIIIFYPFLSKVQIRNQHRILGMILVAYFGFTFLMNVILGY